MAVATRPDVAILDISMPELNGVEAARQIRRSVPQCQILILTMHESEQMLRDALVAGARGFVLKSDAGRNLVTAVDALHHHKPFLTPVVTDVVLEDYLRRGTTPVDADTPHGRLTGREREVLQLLAEGHSSKEVARSLGISVKTADTHRTNVMRKLDLHSLGELVRYAIRNNLIQA
jgi:DNA-binding NarL/FixJ family response regulator